MVSKTIFSLPIFFSRRATASLNCAAFHSTNPGASSASAQLTAIKERGNNRRIDRQEYTSFNRSLAEAQRTQKKNVLVVLCASARNLLGFCTLMGLVVLGLEGDSRSSQ